MKGIWGRITGGLSELLFPTLDRCIYCGKENTQPPYFVCEECGEWEGELWLTEEQTEPFAVMRYAKKTADYILAFKNNGERWRGEQMSYRMAQLLAKKGVTADAVTFVPSTAIKVIRRGYNPARLLAKGIARQLGLKELATLRLGRGSGQKGKTGEERMHFLRRVYALEGAHVSGMVILADDVITTGATLKKCAEALYKMGAQRVIRIAYAASILTRD